MSLSTKAQNLATIVLLWFNTAVVFVVALIAFRHIPHLPALTLVFFFAVVPFAVAAFSATLSTLLSVVVLVIPVARFHLARLVVLWLIHAACSGYVLYKLVRGWSA
ncbi:MAG TPA: hypothetical protein VK139_02510 [Microbacteriaceae bacterium]|nr:hypothetical protein [Microbacteriaceae bacterium]